MRTLFTPVPCRASSFVPVLLGACFGTMVALLQPISVYLAATLNKFDVQSLNINAAARGLEGPVFFLLTSPFLLSADISLDNVADVHNVPKLLSNHIARRQINQAATFL